MAFSTAYNDSFGLKAWQQHRISVNTNALLYYFRYIYVLTTEICHVREIRLSAVDYQNKYRLYKLHNNNFKFEL